MSKDKQVESDEEAPAEWLGEASLIRSYLDRKRLGAWPGHDFQRVSEEEHCSQWAVPPHASTHPLSVRPSAQPSTSATH